MTYPFVAMIRHLVVILQVSRMISRNGDGRRRKRMKKTKSATDLTKERNSAAFSRRRKRTDLIKEWSARDWHCSKR